MTSTINASTSAGIVQTADTSGVLALQGAGTSILTGSAGNTLALQGATSGTGCGISFPATQVASTNANTLDDYEEGTWTPDVYNIGSSSTWATKIGTYRKIGSVVFAWWYCDSGASGGATGNLVVGGIPFSAGNQNYTTVGNWGGNYSGSGSDGFNLLAVNTSIYYYKGGANITAILNYASGCAVYHI